MMPPKGFNTRVYRLLKFDGILNISNLVAYRMPQRGSMNIPTASRILLLVILSVWGFRLFVAEYQNIFAYSSFMHLILLPFHEAGHFFLVPLGEFMTVLGGSLFQLALPIGIGIAFLFRQNDHYGAAICLWWAGASLTDLAPYIWDSINPQLMLLSGMTGDNGGHDWIYLLRRLGVLQYAHVLGSLVHYLGGITMILGLVWGSNVLVHNHKPCKKTINSRGN